MPVSISYSQIKKECVKNYHSGTHEPEFADFISAGTIKVLGNNMKWETMGSTWNAITREIKNDVSVIDTVWEGVHRSYSERYGEINNDCDVILRAVPFQALTSFFTLDLYMESKVDDQYIILDSDFNLGEYQCVVIGNSSFNNPRRKGATRQEIYLDKNRNYIPIKRLYMIPDGWVHVEVNIEYTPNAVVGYVPSNVQITAFQLNKEEGRIWYVQEMDVLQIIMGQPISEDEFAIEFPSGTEVNNEITGERYVIK
jgi:hypothetical protein